MESQNVKDYSTAAVLSVATGILFTEFSRMHDCAEWLMGHDIWSHQFASKEFNGELRAELAKQCPGLPTKEDTKDINRTNWKDFLTKVEAEFGPTIKLRRGSGLTAMLPTDGLDPKKTIVVNITKD